MSVPLHQLDDSPKKFMLITPDVVLPAGVTLTGRVKRHE
jgi:hypothetical protein